MKRKAFIYIPRDQAGTAVLDFLCRRFTYHHRDQWEGLIGCEKVLINGRPCIPGTILESGNSLEYLQPEEEEPPVEHELLHCF